MISSRVIALSLSLLLVPLACGGNKPAAENPPGGGAGSDDASAPSAASAQPTASAAPSGSDSAAASAAPATPPAPAHTPPTLDGSLTGKPFHAADACIVGAGKTPGTVYLEIYAAKDFEATSGCGMLPHDRDARKIGVVIAWKDGAQTDVSKLKAGADPQFFVMQWTDDPKKADRKDAGKDFKPKGTISVVHFGSKKGDIARIKLDVTSGKDKLQGEVDVDVMADLGG